MRNRHAPGLEPYDAKELGAYLTRAHGARLLQQNGSHLKVQLGNGTDVPLPMKGYVPKVLAKTVATRLGMSYSDLRAAVGHPVANGGRSKTIPVSPRPSPHATKAQVIELLDENRQSLLEIDRYIRCGQHDPALYDRLYASLKTVRGNMPGHDGRLTP